MKKKLISLLLVATMAVGLVACGSDAASDSTNNAGGTETAEKGGRGWDKLSVNSRDTSYHPTLTKFYLFICLFCLLSF